MRRIHFDNVWHNGQQGRGSCYTHRLPIGMHDVLLEYCRKDPLPRHGSEEVIPRGLWMDYKPLSEYLVVQQLVWVQQIGLVLEGSVFHPHIALSTHS
jgi:hypothetical protein